VQGWHRGIGTHPYRLRKNSPAPAVARRWWGLSTLHNVETGAAVTQRLGARSRATANVALKARATLAADVVADHRTAIGNGRRQSFATITALNRSATAVWQATATKSPRTSQGLAPATGWVCRTPTRLESFTRGRARAATPVGPRALPIALRGAFQALILDVLWTLRMENTN